MAVADYPSEMPKVRRADEEVLVRGFPEQPAPCLLNLPRVVIDCAAQVGAREMDRVHDRIGEKQEVPSICSTSTAHFLGVCPAPRGCGPLH